MAQLRGQRLEALRLKADRLEQGLEEVERHGKGRAALLRGAERVDERDEPAGPRRQQLLHLGRPRRPLYGGQRAQKSVVVDDRELLALSVVFKEVGLLELAPVARGRLRVGQRRQPGPRRRDARGGQVQADGLPI